ncbi:MAG: hypothetical protein B6I17_00120 [Tenericutes bacterium 4572_104]|nr:MAG: hypothetical protein B6I17_00120 [Tenericutes bacterium 4572_104]
MKKLLIGLILLILSCYISLVFIEAEEYQNYQEIVFDSDDAKLLKDFSDKEYKSYLKKLKKKKFIGWNILIVNEEEHVEFVSETKLKIYNDGFSTIKHDISLSTKEETKYQLSATGSIKITADGKFKKFKGSIDANIKASVSYSSVKTTNETYEFEIIVDPLTYVKIMTRGEGIINNGVGKYYLFWVNTKSGGWETFTLTTEYYEIIKERIS